MDQIVLSDTRQKLTEEIKKLEAVLAALTSERDDLRYHICPELEARYAREIGSFVNRKNYQKIVILEMKRRIEIAQAALNREKAISREHINEQVREEYHDFHEKVREEYQRAERARQKQKKYEEKQKEYEKHWQEEYGNGPGESTEDGTEEEDQGTAEEDSRGSEYYENDSDSDWDSEKSQDRGPHKKAFGKTPDAKDLYRKIIKKLHPDVNPNLTAHEKDLFNKAVEAYENGDLVTLQKIYDEVFGSEMPDPMEKELSSEELLKLKEKIQKRIASLRLEIETIHREIPYRLKKFLDDTKAVAQKRQELELEIHKNEETIQRLTLIYDRICEDLAKLQEL